MNFSVIGVLMVVVIGQFIFALDSRIDQQVFFTKYDKRAKMIDQRDREEKIASADRSMKVDALLNETHSIISSLIYIIDVRLSNHTIHTDRELGDLNGNITKLLRENNKLLHELNECRTTCSQ